MAIDWNNMLHPQMSLCELVLRGSVMYFVLFLLLRVLVRRHIGSMSLMDLLLLVLIADAAQNAMSGEYHSVPEGIVLCGTIILWSYLLDWLAFRYAFIRRLVEPPPLPVILNGKLLRRNLKVELISEEELKSLLRQQNVEDISTIKIAYIEPDGQLTIISNRRKAAAHPPKRSTQPGVT